MDARRILETYGEVLSRYPSPMPPPALAEIIRRESGGNQRAHARGRSFDEIGLCQLVVTKADGTGEAKLADIDPWDATSNIYGAQSEYNRIRERQKNEIAQLGYAALPDADVGAWLTLMQLGRSVGLQGSLTLLGRASAYANHAVDALRILHDRESSRIPELGAQSAGLVKTRLKRALDFPDVVRFVGQLPDRIDGLSARGPEIVAFPSDWSSRLAGGRVA